ncbi:MAG TPA: response regulator [Longimicrobiales bacterium]
MILVIDDDRDFLTTVKAVLENEGYDVITASSGKEGRARVNQARPELVISDVMMETATEGYAVSGAVKMGEMLGDSRTPLIMVSSIGATPDELFPRSEELGVIRPDFYLTKPLDIPRFLEIVRRLVPRVVA